MFTKDPQELFKEALACGQKRDYARSCKILRFLASDDYPGALLYLGRSYHGVGNFLLAVQTFQSYLKQSPESADGHFFLARSLLALELPGKAIAHFHRARKLGFKSTQLLGLLGTAYLKAKNPALAVETLAQAVEEAPKNKGIYIAYINALFVQGIRLFHSGEIDMARQMLQFLVSSGVQGTTVHLYLANCLKELGRFEEALAAYLKARVESPQDSVLTFLIAEMLFTLGRAGEAKKELAKVEGLIPAGLDSASREVWDKVLPYQHFQKENYRQAIFYAIKNLKTQPNDEAMHVVLAESYHQLGQMDKSAAHYRQAIKSTPDQIEILYGLLMVLWENGDYQAAFQEIKRILKIAPQDESAHYYAVLAACKLGKPTEETLPALRELIHRRGADPFLFSALAEEYTKSGLDELALGWAKKTLRLTPYQESAVQLLIRLTPDFLDPDLSELLIAYLDYEPQDSEVIRHLVHHYFALKNYKAAQKQILTLFSLGKKTPALQRALAFTYRWQESWTEALLVYQDLLLANPQDPEILSGIILCLFKTGRQETALQFARKALAQGRSSPLLHYHLGQIYLALQEWSQALASFRKVLEDWPQHWQSVEKISQVYQAQGDLSQYEKFAKHALNMKQKAKN